jgi:methionyl-tRNA synthetase
LIILISEYLQYEGDKFSKSRGIGVFGDQASLTGIPSSVFRYYLLSSRPESSDSQFLWREFITKNNTELLNNLGNLVNRIIKFLNAKYKGIVPDYTQDTADTVGVKRFETDVNQILTAYIEAMDSLRLKLGLKLAMDLSARCNLLLQENKLDNNLFNNFPERCAATLGTSINAIYLLSAMLCPFIPATSDAIDEQINAPRLAIPDQWRVGDVLPGHNIGKAQYLFSKIPEEKEEEWKSKFGGSPK